MRRVRFAEQALSLSTSSARQPYVCRACLARTARQFSTSNPIQADQPFFQRMRDGIFGTQKSAEAQEARDSARKRKVDDIQAHGQAEKEVKTDRQGREYEVAEVVDPVTHKDYVVANTWEGLESVGSEEWVKQREDQGEVYVGFLPAKKTAKMTDQDWKALLHHITVEALALQRAGRNPLEVCNSRGPKPKSFGRTKSATFGPEPDSLRFQDSLAEQKILESILRDQSPQTPPPTISPGLVDGTIPALEDDAWMSLSLRDSTLKLAIVKRAMQLTGHRFADAAISTSNTLADLWNAIKTREQPKKLFKTEQMKTIQSIPNVMAHATRRTPIHKEKQIGRWKIIEDELTLRNLPVTGSRLLGAKEVLRAER